MKTFFNILQTICSKSDSENNNTIKIYPCDPFINLFDYQTIDANASHLINMIYYYSQKQQIQLTKGKAKFAALSYFLDNTFNSNEFKDAILALFSAAQRHYHAFSRLAHIYKTKKYPIVADTDMALNTIGANDKGTIMLIDGKSKYYFSLNDLISIVEGAIGNTSDFFLDVMWPTNPYNNQKLTYSVLYNLYFKMKSSARIMSSLFHFFFLEGFNLETFSVKYETHIRKRGIHQMAYNAPHITVYYDVLAMLKSNIYTRNYIIHKDFPKKTLVAILRPFLYCYLITNYYIQGTEEVAKNKKLLFCTLKKFYEYNKVFGRKNIKITSTHCFLTNKTKTTKVTIYNTEHVSFYNIKLTNRDFTEYEYYVKTLRYRNRGLLYNMVQTNNNTAEHIILVDEWHVTTSGDLESDNSSDIDTDSSYENDDVSVS
jgi:hypothetical protein